LERKSEGGAAQRGARPEENYKQFETQIRAIVGRRNTAAAMDVQKYYLLEIGFPICIGK